MNRPPPPAHRRPRWPLAAAWLLGIGLALVLIAVTVARTTSPEPAQLDGGVLLTPIEREWLRTAPEVIVGIQPDYAPFTFIDERGGPSGYANELFVLAARKVGLRYRFLTGPSWQEMLEATRRGEIDVLTCLWISDERQRDLLFVTPPYLRHTLVVATRADDPDRPRRDHMDGKRLVVVRDFAINQRLHTLFPRAHFVEADSATAALKQLSFGQADAYIDNVGLIHYTTALNGLVNVRVGEEFVMPGFDYYMAVPRDRVQLHAILGKALQAVTTDELRVLERRWMRAPDTGLRALARRHAVPGVASLVLLLLGSAALVWWNRRLSSEVALRKQAQAEASEQATALQASVRLQQSLLDAAQAAIMVIDSEGRWCRFNPFAEHLLGWRAEDLLGKVVRYDQLDLPDTSPLLLAPAHITDTVERLSALLGRPVPADWRAMFALAELQRPPGDVCMLHKDGHDVPVQLSLARILDSDGQALGLVCIAVDLTLQKKLQAQLRASEAQAQDANRAKSAFLASMSHEIRTPMNGVVGMIEVLAHTALDPEQRRVLNIVQQSSQSLLQIIGDILDFSKIEAGRMELAPTPVRLPALLRSTVGNYIGAASSKGLVLEFHGDPRLAPAHLADPLRWRQIVGNLLANAIKFTDAGQVDIALEWEGDRDDGALGSQAMCLRVTDTGIGVSAEEQGRLFQPFSQASGGTQQAYGGTGLGLAICQRLAQLMDGELSMESAPGQGTTMRLRVVLARADETQVPVEAVVASIEPVFTPRPLPTLARAEQERSLVLVVDDHPTNRLVIARQLALAGYLCETADDGEQGLGAWRSGRYALVLTDVHMPRLDGYQLAQAIRDDEARRELPRTPVIALTANAMKGEAERCLAAGMDDFLIKPTPVAVLSACLQRWLPHTAVDRAVAVADGASSVHAEAAPAASGEVSSAPASRPSMPVLDRAVLSLLVGGDQEQARAVLQDFLDTTHQDLIELETARAASDVQAIVRQAHRIKGAAKLVGATQLAHATAELERAGAQEGWAVLPPLMDAVNETAQRLRGYVEQDAAS